MLGLQNEREWAAFCSQVLLAPELAADPRFNSNSKRTASRQELREIIVAAFSELTSEEVIIRLDAAQIANARMNDMSDVWTHPQLQQPNRWLTVDSPAGKIPALLPPGISNATDVRLDAVPALGQHTEALLNELGFSTDAIRELREAAIV